MQTLLEASALAKAYGPRPAVRAVSLQLRAGELLALLGPNGAGKSTIGLVPQEIALFEELGAARNVALFGALYGLSRAQLAERVPQVLAQVGLAERAQDRPQTFSGGMKRRLNIACALVHDPAVLLLDEPTAGVDPHSRNAIFEILEALKRQGKALLYTTHYMEEAEHLADRIVIVDQGQVVAEGTLPELLQRLPATARLRLDLQGKPQLEALRALPGLRSLHQPHSGQLEVGVDELATGTVLLLEALTAQGVRVRTSSST